VNAVFTSKALIPALAVGLALLSACGSPGGTGGTEQASVASLATPTTAEASTPKPPVAERPLIRPDTSKAEIARMTKVYLNCLKDSGVPAATMKMFSAKGGPDSETAAKYQKQCGSKQAQQLFDKARTSDPDFADHLRTDATCLNRHGIRAEIRKDGDIWLLDDLPPDSKAHWLDDCEQEAFAGYYKTLN
jgi:hypothetical protein